MNKFSSLWDNLNLRMIEPLKCKETADAITHGCQGSGDEHERKLEIEIEREREIEI